LYDVKTSKEGLGELADPFVEPKAIVQRGCCRGKIIPISAGLIIAGFMVFCAGAASPVENPGDFSQVHDLLPVPSTLLELAKPASVLAILERQVDLNSVSTNQAELDLVSEVKTMQKKLQVLEEAAYAKDPLLRTFGKYSGKTHDWVMKYHAREFNAANRYFNSGGQTNLPEVNKMQNMLIDLIDMDLFHEVANNTNWAPLLKAGFEATASRIPDLRTSYARNDTLIGFHPATAPVPVITFETYAAEIERRSALVKAKLDEIQWELAVPDEVVAGWWYGDLYRMLDGNAQLYLELRTPQALTRLREQLRRKYIDLSQMQAASGTKRP
jgi:hypothetical protein